MHSNSILRWTIILFAGLAMFWTSVQARANPKDVEKAINDLNNAFKKQDAETIKAMTADEHVAITSYLGLQSRADQLKSIGDLKITEYTVKNLKVTMLSKDTAI